MCEFERIGACEVCEYEQDLVRFLFPFFLDRDFLVK